MITILYIQGGAIMEDKKRKQYEEYFADILAELEKEFDKSTKYSETIDAEITKFADLTSFKGGQHYLTEHLKNAISLQSQRQSLIKDKFSIKKAILDYTFKTDDEGSEQNLFKELQKLVEDSKEKIKKSNDNHEKVVNEIENKNLDAEIDEALINYPEEDDE
jgi:hypothetical protein